MPIRMAIFFLKQTMTNVSKYVGNWNVHINILLVGMYSIEATMDFNLGFPENVTH